jgi:S-adenosylmethionine:tRNA-ribosyltransferase-isomerase (queuine synthetase)
MKTSDFDFNLPEELIAQTPILNRSESKLLVLDKETGEITHERFYNIVNYLNENDILVLNNTKVIPARIYGVKEATGAKIELLILKNLRDNVYECLVRPARRIHVGDIVSINSKEYGGIMKRVDKIEGNNVYVVSDNKNVYYQEINGELYEYKGLCTWVDISEIEGVAIQY